MRRHLLRLWLALMLLSLGSMAARAQPAPADAPPWEQWFDALNVGDVAGVLALMTSVAGEGGVPVERCAGGCRGMDEIAAGIARMVADGYWGRIDPATVEVVEETVTFDVTEVAGPAPHLTVTTTHWVMELDGGLIAPVCAEVCLRSPTARAALRTAQAAAVTALPIVPPSVPSRAAAPPARVTVAVPQPTGAAHGRGTDPTPVRWVLAGLTAGLLVMVASAGLDAWCNARRRPPAAP